MPVVQKARETITQVLKQSDGTNLTINHKNGEIECTLRPKEQNASLSQKVTW